MIYIHYSTLCSRWCLMCQWICYCFSDGTTERWIQRQKLIQMMSWPDCERYRWDLTSTPLNMTLPLTVDFGVTNLVSSCTAWNQHCIYCSWQHWLCLHAWRYLLLMWLFWFCVAVLFSLITRRNLCKAPPLVVHGYKSVGNNIEAHAQGLILYTQSNASSKGFITGWWFPIGKWSL